MIQTLSTLQRRGSSFKPNFGQAVTPSALPHLAMGQTGHGPSKPCFRDNGFERATTAHMWCHSNYDHNNTLLPHGRGLWDEDLNEYNASIVQYKVDMCERANSVCYTKADNRRHGITYRTKCHFEFSTKYPQPSPVLYPADWKSRPQNNRA